MNFDPIIERQLAGRVIRRAYLIEFFWKSLEKKADKSERFWRGNHELTAGGKVWQPTRGLGDVTGIGAAYDSDAPEITIAMSGVDKAFIAKARGSKEEYYGRPVRVFLQFFDENFRPVGEPVAASTGLMHTFDCQKKPVNGGTMYTATITAESPIGLVRSRAPNAYLDDASQKARFSSVNPPDQALEGMALLDGRRFPWPPV